MKAARDRKSVLIAGGTGRMAEFVAFELAAVYDVALFDARPVGDDRTRLAPLSLLFVKGTLLSLGDCMGTIAFSRSVTIVRRGAAAGPREHARPYRIQQRDDEDAGILVDTMGTFYLLDAARRPGVRKIVAASSDWMLGHGGPISTKPFKVEYLPIDEQHPVRPENSDGSAKWPTEYGLETFARAYDMQSVALRFAWADSKTAKNPPGCRARQSHGERPAIEPSQRGLRTGDVRPFPLYSYIEPPTLLRCADWPSRRRISHHSTCSTHRPRPDSPSKHASFPTGLSRPFHQCPAIAAVTMPLFRLPRRGANSDINGDAGARYRPVSKIGRMRRTRNAFLQQLRRAPQRRRLL